MNFRFTATLNRPHGSRIFQGTADGCRGLADAIYVVREILQHNEAFEPEVTALKITISPSKTPRKSKP